MKKYVCPITCSHTKFSAVPSSITVNFEPGTPHCGHVIGVGAKDQVEADVYEGLKAILKANVQKSVCISQ